MENENNYWKSETIAFLALQSIRGVGFKTLYNIAIQKISFSELIKTDNIEYFEKTIRKNLDHKIKISNEAWMQFKLDLWSIGHELARKYIKQNIRIFFYNQDTFPEQLRNIPEPPMWLFVEGNYQILNLTSIAIVGSRKPTEDGLWLTKYVVASLVSQNLISVSGLADGIDQKAHFESIAFNIPTIAVLGTAIDRNYPRGSEYLRSLIISNGGAVVSEYLLGQNYSAENFIRRNRIQAGLSKIIIPVEWNIKSGTAHTVNFAKKYNRFLVMPYLYDSDLEKDEIKLIHSYKRGRIFNVPNEFNEFIMHLKQPKEQNIHTTHNQCSQILMDFKD